MTRTFLPSPQQQAIFSFITSGQGNLIIEAVAGAGKTTTLIEAMKLMTGSVAFAAYNKKIADEIAERVAGQAGVRASTFHSFGFSAWRKVAPRIGAPNDKKVAQLCAKLAVPEQMVAPVCKLVSLAKQHAIGFLSPMADDTVWFNIVAHHDLEDELPEPTLDASYTVEDLVAMARRALEASVAANMTEIDFDDMLYAPLVGNARMTQYDWVLIDEAQDTNPARRALAKKMLRPGGRLIAVGDPHQAIYGFTGADADSLDLIAREFHAERLPLSVSFRCAQSVVAKARQFVSHIEPALDAPQGAYNVIEEPAFHKLTPVAGEAILCRNTKPLITLAYGLLRRRITCYVEGRDIGRGLLALVNRWKIRSVDALADKLEDYCITQTQKMMAKGEEMQAQSLSDRIEALLFIINEILPPGTPVSALVTEINNLFADSNGGPAKGVVLSTIHKSKGREWSRVYWYGANKFQPSKFARQTWQQEQETNLMYVAATRAKLELIEVLAPTKEG